MVQHRRVLDETIVPPRRRPNQRADVLSKGAKGQLRFQVEAVRHPDRDGYKMGKIDDEASIRAFKDANPQLSEEFIRLTSPLSAHPINWISCPQPHPILNEEGELEEAISGSEKFRTADIIVTTFAQARLLQLRNQHLPRDWTVWFDDPDVSDVHVGTFSPTIPSDMEKFQKDQQREAGRARQASGQKYFARDSRQSLGAAVRRHRCVYTTTEKVTLRAAEKLVKDRGERVVVHDMMEGVTGGKITLLGTNKVIRLLRWHHSVDDPETGERRPRCTVDCRWPGPA